MRDSDTTIKKLKLEIIEMCRRKGWGIDGIQNPQHVTMAMVVEAMELMEHFVGITEKDEQMLMAGSMRDERIEIAEEMSDVLMYSMQLMYTLGIDVSKGLCEDFSDDYTFISELCRYAGNGSLELMQQAMMVGVKARFVLEAFQWMNDDEVKALTNGANRQKANETGNAFAGLFREILILANMLDIDISASITRKIAIVDKRVYPEDDPVR